jgi:serine/threonine protein kinase
MENHPCPTCHAPIPANAPGGFCPACLLRDAEEPPTYGHRAPPLEEIAAAFPQLEVLGLIGQGGMGFVYKVRQPGLDRIVALKILSPELGRDPAFAERFSREARTLGKLHHPNIVTVFEHGESGGFFYLVMEYVDGVNLRQAMRAGRFTPEQALAIVPGICDALQTAHEQGIWHRDIKPENILLDREGRVKIADFGIARIVGDPQRDFTLTRTGNALGSISYMAPEQHEKPHEVDHRADIYSLGVVIYEMLTGELPLGRFPAPSQRAAVDARIDEIVFKTLEKERELRQQSATEVKTDVHRAVQAGIGTGPAGPVESPGKASDLAKLACGLLFGGVLACPLLAAAGLISRNHELAVIATLTGVVCVLLALILGCLNWRERLGRFTAIASACLLLLAVLSAPFFTISLSRSDGAEARPRATRSGISANAESPARTARGDDFSSPKSAMEKIIRAAREKDTQAFIRGFSKEVTEGSFYSGPELAERMREWEGITYVRLDSRDGDHAVVTLRNANEEEEHMMQSYLMRRENGEWKFTLIRSGDER